MVEQTGEEIDWERCPPDAEDFPESVINAMSIYNSMSDRIYPEIGYIGKDFQLLDYLYELYNIEEKIEKEWIFELLLFLDSHNIAESQRKLKAEYDKIKKR